MFRICWLLSLIVVSWHLTTPQAQAQEACPPGYFRDTVYSATEKSTHTYGNNVNHQGQATELVLDLYQPVGDPSPLRPVLIFMHDGGFIIGNRNLDHIAYMCQYYARTGFVTASIDYRKGISPLEINAAGVSKAAIRGLQDARAAVRWFRAQAIAEGNPHRIDTNQIFFAGASAGGVTALHLAYLNTRAEADMFISDTATLNQIGGLEGQSGNPGYSSEVKGVINLCGAMGFVEWIDAGEAPVISVHSRDDDAAPYAQGPLVFNGITIQGLTLDGSYRVDSAAQAQGIESHLLTWDTAGHIPFAASATGGGGINWPYMWETLNFITPRLANWVDCEALGSVLSQSEPRMAVPSPRLASLADGYWTLADLPSLESPADLRVLDLAGRTLAQFRIEPNAQDIPFALPAWQGMAIVQVQQGGQGWVWKLVR